MVHAFDAVDAGVILWDGCSRVVYVNPAARALLGWTDGDGGSLPPAWRVTADAENRLDPGAWPWERCRDDGGAIRSELLRFRPPAGAEKWVSVSVAALEPDGGPPFATAAILHDVTKARSQLLTQERVISELSEANEVKTGMVASAAHELRTPLTGLLGSLETLETLWDQIDADSRAEMMEVAGRCGRRIERITADLFSLAQAQASSLKVDPEDFLIEESVRLVLSEIPGGDDVVVDIDPELEAFCDVGHFERIIRNLVVNAFRYGAAPISVNARPAGQHVDIRVTDRGLGVAPEFIPRLFEKFARNAQFEGGSGLGLAIVDTLVRANAGEVHYEPADPGATFRVKLPAIESAAIDGIGPTEESHPRRPASPEAGSSRGDGGLGAATADLVEWQYDVLADDLTASGPMATVLGIDDTVDPLHALRTALAPIILVVQAGAGWEDYELEVNRPGDGDGRLLARARRRRDGSISGVLLDTSDRMATAERLAELVDRYKLIIELSPDMVVVHEQGKVRYINRTGMRILNSSTPSDFIGRPITEFVVGASIGSMLERIRGLEVPGDYSEPAEIWLRSVDGTEIALESVSVRTTWEGRPAFQVILRDLSGRRQAEAAVRYQAGLVAAVSDAIIATGTNGLVTSWNPAAEKLYGVKATDAIGRPMADLVGPDALDDDGRVRPGTLQHRRGDGEWLTVEVSVAPVPGERGQPAGEVAICADRSAEAQAAAERRRAANQLQAVVSALNEGIMVFGGDGTALMINDAARRILGAAADLGTARELVDAARLCHADGTPVAMTQGAEPFHDLVIGFRGPNGENRWASVNSQNLEATPDQPSGSVVYSFTDVTEQRAAQARLRHEATHDNLTGLPNRLSLLRTLEDRLQDGRPVAVLFTDLDRFKSINDAHGHRIGDAVLKTVGTRVQAALDGAAVVARLSGDEFVAVVSDQERGAVLELAERVRVALARPIPLPETGRVSLTASVGVAFAEPGRSAEDLLVDADLAMYEAKRLGRSRSETFAPSLRAVARRRSDIASRLMQALAAEQLMVAYQPILSLGGDRVYGAEALARWTDPELGPIGPNEFVPVAEEYALVNELGQQVMSTAFRTAARVPDLRISVNLSIRQLGEPKLVRDIQRALVDTHLDPDRVWFEVTESAVMEDVDFAQQVLGRIRDLGAHLSIDDFGTGYSSLAYLSRLPVETLKIDRSFVNGLGSPQDDAIVAAVVDLAHTLGRTVVAEGVETEEQLAWLRGVGCDAVQGYLIGRPGPSFPS